MLDRTPSVAFRKWDSLIERWDEVLSAQEVIPRRCLPGVNLKGQTFFEHSAALAEGPRNGISEYYKIGFLRAN